MSVHVPFTFRNMHFVCTIDIDTSEKPCYVFVELQEQELIAEFGKEITIKTDFERRLPKEDDYPALVALRHVIFEAIKGMPDFMAKRKLLVSLAIIPKITGQ